MADPSQMFNVPQQTEGPLAGYMRGIMGDYGIQQQNQAAAARDIENQRSQLGLETMQKDVPLQDLSRQNAMSAGQDTAGKWADGTNKQISDLESQNKISTGQANLDATQIARMNSQMTWWTNAAGVMAATPPADKEKAWADLYDQGSKAGVKGLTQQWGGAQTQSTLDARRDAAIKSQPVLAKMLEQSHAGDTQIRVAQAELPGKIQIAKAGYDNQLNKTLLGMQPDQRAITIADQKVSNGFPLDQGDVGALINSERTKFAQSKEVEGYVARESQQYSTSTPDDRKAKNKEAGLPLDSNNVNSYSVFKQNEYIDQKAIDAVKTRYPTAHVIVNGEDKKLTDVLGTSNTIPKTIQDTSPSKQSNVSTKGSPPADMPPARYKQAKDAGFSDADIAKKWEAFKAKSSNNVPPVAPVQAAPVVSQGTGPITDSNQLWGSPPLTPGQIQQRDNPMQGNGFQDIGAR